MSQNPSFVIDSMLGTIAKKMRILGFDSKYSASIDDEDLILLAKKENRTIITKDSQVVNNAKKHDILTVDIVTHTEKEQLIEIAKKTGFKKYEFNSNSARCPVCNGILHGIEKRQIIDKVPPKIAQNVRDFWICESCKHIYWEGTHIRNLKKLIAEINDQL
ncbi:MAG TPA: Mut7-C RNAse domain-containing protein [Candidatus Nitrosotenuis sp.]|nr:Mut7-C RNAse domain-containing protein [Candidatus Nitrosotenuis sp.]